MPFLLCGIWDISVPYDHIVKSVCILAKENVINIFIN